MPETIVLDGRIYGMPRPGPPRICECGECQRCRERERQRELRKGVERNRICAAEDCDESFYAKRANTLYCSTRCRNRQANRRASKTSQRNEYKRKWAERNQDRLKAYSADWYRRRGKEVRRAYKQDKTKQRAQTAAYVAIRDGTLVRQPCEICGASQVDAHHPDYSKPLGVRWLCRKHHRAVHAGQVVLSQSN